MYGFLLVERISVSIGATISIQWKLAKSVGEMESVNYAMSAGIFGPMKKNAKKSGNNKSGNGQGGNLASAFERRKMPGRYDFIKEAHNTKCLWREDFDGSWETSCDEMFGLNAGTPSENHYHFCPACGRKIKEMRYGH